MPPGEWCEGPNFYFGRGRAGDVNLLAELCLEREIALTIAEPERVDGEYISSSRVRDILQVARGIGFPIMVKAAAGGGGRGMRRVERAEDLPAALVAGSSEAASAFGDGSVYIERVIQPARHIEVQLLGDVQGQVVALVGAAATKEQTVRRVLRLMAEELSIGVQEPTYPWTGMNGTQDGQPADTLAFVTLSDGLGAQGAQESDRLRVIYTREGDRLIRFVRRNLYGLTDESLEQIDLANKVTGFNVRYYSGQSRVWADEWTANGPMPTAVLVEVTFQEAGAEPYTIREWITVGVS